MASQNFDASAVFNQGKALVAGDVAALEQLFDDDLVWTHSSGKIDSKESFLQPFRVGPSRYERFSPEVSRVRDLGDTVIVHGVVAIASRSVEGLREFSNLFIAVWSKAGGTWRLAAWQSTRQP